MQEITVFIKFYITNFPQIHLILSSQSIGCRSHFSFVVLVHFVCVDWWTTREREAYSEKNEVECDTNVDYQKFNRFQKHTPKLAREWDLENEAVWDRNSFSYRLLYTMLYKLVSAIWNVDSSDMAIMIFNRLKQQLQHLQYISGQTHSIHSINSYLYLFLMFALHIF